MLAPPGPPAGKPRKRRRLVDRTVGIALGIAIGIAVIALFVFLGGEGAIDAPSVSGTTSTERTAPLPPHSQPARPQAGQ
ncbi:MAG TPA: hypothetical protein VG518_07875 [Solirubrobacterales bacterium]|nr:hypothetical protein [Solirubrobacterales bacterium]